MARTPPLPFGRGQLGRGQLGRGQLGRGTLERGTPGQSADAEYRRRLARDEAARKARFGRLAGIVGALAGERPATRAWSVGADGERRVGAALEHALGSKGIVLHDRCTPGSRGNIDHIAIAPSGVWVVDAKEHRGHVWRRDVGGWFRSDVRLYVGRRDHGRALEGVRRQGDAVERVLLRDLQGDAPPLRTAICLVGADWGRIARPFRIGGVWISWPSRLGGMLRRPALLTAPERERVAAILVRRFPVR